MPLPSHDHLMFDSIKLENFRGYKRAEAKGLGRINIVVGDNGSGKTALLEALTLAAGNDVKQQVRFGTLRGTYDSNVVTLNTEEVRSGDLWRDWFYQFRRESRILISCGGSPSRSLSIERHDAPVAVAGTAQQAAIKFVWATNGQKHDPIIPEIIGNNIHFPTGPVGVNGAFFGTNAIPGNEAAKRFSDLDIPGRAEFVKEYLRSQFDQITDLTVQSGPSGSLLYATLKDTPVKIPLPLISSGINRWVAILVGIATYPNGALLVDEIDIGIHASRLASLWDSVVETANRVKAQIFASTHSLECLRAARMQVEMNPEVFRLIRCHRGGTLEVFSGSQLGSALESGFEIRT